MENYDIYAIGNALVDIEYHLSIKDLSELAVEKGVMTLIDEQQQNSLINHLGESHDTMACGGSAANTVIAMAQMGANAYFNCRVANDITGQFFADDLYQSGVDSNLKLDQADLGVTGKCLVFVTPDADRTMNTFLGASVDLSPIDIDETAIKRSDLIYIEGYLVSADKTLSAAIEAKRLAQKHAKKVAFTLSDPNMLVFFRDQINEVIGDGVDLLFANEEEALELAQTKDFSEAIEKMKRVADTFAITRGKQGAVVFDGKHLIEIEGHHVEAIDTLGAGDLFAGAFIYGLSQGMSFQQSGDLASLAASKIVTQYGPRMTASETKKILAKFNAGI